MFFPFGSKRCFGRVLGSACLLFAQKGTLMCFACQAAAKVSGEAHTDSDIIERHLIDSAQSQRYTGSPP
jgi:hypothetical protein